MVSSRRSSCAGPVMTRRPVSIRYTSSAKSSASEAFCSTSSMLTFSSRLSTRKISNSSRTISGARPNEGSSSSISFRRMGDAEAHDVLDRAPGDALSREADVAGGAQHARYGAQRGGLAGAVGAQQRRDAALRHVEIEPEQHLGAAVECAQPSDLEQGAHDVVPR